MKVEIEMDEAFDQLVVARLKDSEHTLLLCLSDLVGPLQSHQIQDLVAMVKDLMATRDIIEYYSGDRDRPLVFPERMNEEYKKQQDEIFASIELAKPFVEPRTEQERDLNREILKRNQAIRKKKKAKKK